MLDGVLVAPNGVAFIVGRLKLGMFILLPVVVVVPAVAVPVVEEGLLAPMEEAVLLFPKGVCLSFFSFRPSAMIYTL